MNKAVGIIGWVLAFLLLASTAFLYRVNGDLDTRLTKAIDEREGVLVRVDEQAERNAELAEVVAKLSASLEDTQKRMIEVEKVTYALETRPPSFLSFLDGVFRFLTGTEGASSIFDTFGGVQGIIDPQAISKAIGTVLDEDFADSAASLTIDVQYDAFIESLDIYPSSREEEIRAAFIEGKKRQVEHISKAMQGDLDAADQAEDPLRAHIATVLTPDELDRFDLFLDEEVERTSRRNFEVQLNLFADELTPESHDRVLDAFVAETLRLRSEEGDKAADRLDPTAWLDSQRTVYERALERVRGDLDDDQFQVVEGFAESQLKLLDFGSSIVGRLFQRGDRDADPQ